MAIVILCPGCTVRLTLTDDRAGTSLNCPKCGSIIAVPGVHLPVPPPITRANSRLPVAPSVGPDHNHKHKVHPWAVGVGLSLCLMISIALYVVFGHGSRPQNETTAGVSAPTTTPETISGGSVSTTPHVPPVSAPTTSPEPTSGGSAPATPPMPPAGGPAPAMPTPTDKSPRDLPLTIRTFIGQLHEGDGTEADVARVKFLAMRGWMKPTDHDKLGLSGPGREPDLRIDGVYFVAFKRPVWAGPKFDIARYQRLLFFMRPGGGPWGNDFAVVAQPSDDWRADVRAWLLESPPDRGDASLWAPRTPDVAPAPRDGDPLAELRLLAKALKDPSPEKRLRALERIATFGMAGSSVVGTDLIAVMLLDTKPAVRDAACETLEKVNPKVYPHVFTIIRGETDKKKDAIESLSAMGSDASIALPLLIYCQNNPDVWRSLRGIGRFDMTDEKPDLFPLIAKIDPKNKLFASTVLTFVSTPPGMRGTWSPEKELLYNNFNPRAFGLKQMNVIDATTAEKVKALTAALNDEKLPNDIDMTIQVIAMTQAFGSDAIPALPALKRLKLSPIESIRRAATLAIETIAK